MTFFYTCQSNIEALHIHSIEGNGVCACIIKQLIRRECQHYYNCHVFCVFVFLSTYKVVFFLCLLFLFGLVLGNMRCQAEREALAYVSPVKAEYRVDNLASCTDTPSIPGFAFTTLILTPRRWYSSYYSSSYSVTFFTPTRWRPTCRALNAPILMLNAPILSSMLQF